MMADYIIVWQCLIGGGGVTLFPSLSESTWLVVALRMVISGCSSTCKRLSWNMGKKINPNIHFNFQPALWMVATLVRAALSYTTLICGTPCVTITGTNPTRPWSAHACWVSLALSPYAQEPNSVLAPGRSFSRMLVAMATNQASSSARIAASSEGTVVIQRTRVSCVHLQVSLPSFFVQVFKHASWWGRIAASLYSIQIPLLGCWSCVLTSKSIYLHSLFVASLQACKLMW